MLRIEMYAAHNFNNCYFILTKQKESGNLLLNKRVKLNKFN